MILLSLGGIFVVVLLKALACQGSLLVRGQTEFIKANNTEETTRWKFKRHNIEDKVSLRIDSFTPTNWESSILVIRDGRQGATEYEFRMSSSGIQQKVYYPQGDITIATVSLPILLVMDRKRMTVALVLEDGGRVDFSALLLAYDSQAEQCNPEKLEGANAVVTCPGKGIVPGVPFCNVMCEENYTQLRTHFVCEKRDWTDLPKCNPIKEIMDNCESAMQDEMLNFQCPYEDNEIATFMFGNYADELDFRPSILARSTSSIGQQRRRWFQKVCQLFCRFNRSTKVRPGCGTQPRMHKRCITCKHIFKCNTRSPLFA